MNRSLLLLFFLTGGIRCDYRLNPQENQGLKSYCGTKTNHPRRFESRKTAGGQPTNGYEAPWAAYIQYPNNWCSATIISPRHVMSASHCLMSDMTQYDHRFNGMRRKCSGNDLILYPENNSFAVRNSYGGLLSGKVFKTIPTFKL
ncbi:Protein CBG04421 [Caenorhabditis briggsae]|uniref:Protein CBG04421 n=1 Tax=Caenorhabditis briggsae TaxID=6238 RepID=A8WXH9_CAEBR|nr:Protein CBG04421 [Caenorhabditis briggsae]CAP25122.2 Protein CBG04421 [Caenorhabditis briggsae]